MEIGSTRASHISCIAKKYPQHLHMGDATPNKRKTKFMWFARCYFLFHGKELAERESMCARVCA